VSAIQTSSLRSHCPLPTHIAHDDRRHASAKQIAYHEHTFVFDETTGQRVHKAGLLARECKQRVDATPGAGRTRYVKGVRFAIQSDDKDGTGFQYDDVYEVQLDEHGRLLIERRRAAAGGCHCGGLRAHPGATQGLRPYYTHPPQCTRKGRSGVFGCD
jgi:hypothetical protein